MKLENLSASQSCSILRAEGLALSLPPFNVRITSSIPSVGDTLRLLYGSFDLAKNDDFVDFNVTVDSPSLLRKWYRPQVNFSFDGYFPFIPLPLEQAYPILEWGINWSIATTINHCLVIHAATIERDGKAIIMPAPPGSGKSTLCTGLVVRGWRLLSDEFALISLDDLSLTPSPRAISLKNQSIDIIKRFQPDVVMSPPTPHTTKGTIAYMRTPEDSVSRQKEKAVPGWIVFPRYLPDAEARLETLSKSQTVLELATNAFNYSVLGRQGFETLTDLAEQCVCYRFTYSKLDDAIAIFDELCSSTNH